MAKRRVKRPKPSGEGVPPSSATTFTEIGGSPAPGVTLRQVLRGHDARILRIAWSPDGAYLASPSEDGTIRIWEWRSGNCVTLWERHQTSIQPSPGHQMAVAWLQHRLSKHREPDYSSVTQVWETATLTCLAFFGPSEA